jgi:hypothetical protein
MENFKKHWNDWKWYLVGIILGLLIFVFFFFFDGYNHIISLLPKEEDTTEVEAGTGSFDNSLTTDQITLAIEKGTASLVSRLGKDTTVVICNCCPEKNVKVGPSKPKARAKKNKVIKSPEVSTSTSNPDHQYSDGCNCWICNEIRNPCNNCKDVVDVNCNGDC